MRGGGSSATRPETPKEPPTSTGLASLNATNAGYAAAAASKAANAKPLAGSITQSSNVGTDNVTRDKVTVTAERGANGTSYSVENSDGSWSIDTSNGNHVSLGAGATGEFAGQELYRHVNGGTLYVDVYSDIEAPTTRQESVPGPAGTPVEIQEGDQIAGLTLDEINARMGDGTLNGVSGTFSCNRAGGGNCPAFFGFFPIGTDWRFTPHGSGSTRTVSTPDTDYLAGGVWLFIPDDATSADDVEIGAFGDGNDPFKQSNLMALTGTASYAGGAAGIYVDGSENEVAYINADVSLTANFRGQSDLGSINGRVTGFKVAEVDGVDTVATLPGSLSLGTADIGSSNSGFFEGRLSGTVDGTGYTGRWGGQFFGNSESDGKPGSVGGTLGGSSTDGNTSFVGVFGAHRQ